MGQWERFLGPYKQAVDELKVKFRGMRSNFLQKARLHPLNLLLVE